MPGKSSSKMQVLGPGSLTLGGINAGYIEQGKLILGIQDVELTAGDTGGDGGTPHDVVHKCTKATLELMLDQVEFQIYAAAMQAAVRETSGANEVLGVGTTAGTKLTPVELILTPVPSAIAATHILKFWRAVPRGDREIVLDANQQQKMKVTFEALWDETKAEGRKLLLFGNTSVASDTTAPTISSSIDDTTGVSVSAAKDTTFSEQLDPASVNEHTVILFVATETGVQAKVAATVSLDSGGTVVSITPSSALSAATQYNIVFTSGIKDTAGNRFAGSKISFTTA